LDTSWKFSRASAAALLGAAAAHVLLVYLLITLGSTRATSKAPSVKPIIVRLIYQPRPPIEVWVTINPKPVKLQINPPQIPDFHIDVPAEPIPSGRPDTPLVGSPGLPGPVNQVGGPLTLNVIHYVAPIYSLQAARAGEHGSIAMALLVDAQGNVDQIKILRSTGSSRLDRAAVSAVRQWKFAADKNGVRREPVWGEVRLRFTPPQRLLRVPVIVMPYSAIARDIDAEIATNRARHLDSTSSEVSVRSLLQKLITAFANERAKEPGTTRESAGDWVEAELGLMGPIQSLKFLGFVEHGIDLDQSASSHFQDLQRLERTHWEIYDVEQDHGSSVWLVAATARGSIQRIEVALR
jgi:TonB family protein